MEPPAEQPLKVTDEQLGIGQGCAPSICLTASLSIKSGTQTCARPVRSVLAPPPLWAFHTLQTPKHSSRQEMDRSNAVRGVTAEGIELDLGNLSAFDPSAPATRDGDEARAQATALTQVGYLRSSRPFVSQSGSMHKVRHSICFAACVLMGFIARRRI